MNSTQNGVATVLVVDDQEMLTLLMCKTLEKRRLPCSLGE